MHHDRRSGVVRGVVTATLAIFAALAGHIFGGGAPPGPLGVLVPWVLALMVCTIFAGRRLSVLRLSISVALSQLLFHTLFVLGSISPTTQLGHVHGLPAELPISTAIGAGSPMWAGHAVAAAVTIVALHQGERMLLRLRDLGAATVAWLRGHLGVVLFTQRPPCRVPRRGIRAHAPRVALEVPLRTLRRRGPPALHTV